MEHIEQFWATLVDNVVFLMVMLPLVGACLVVAVSGFGIESIRRTALTNVLLTLALAVLMVVHYDPQKQSSSGQRELFQMVSANLFWLGTKTEERTDGSRSEQGVGGPRVRLAVGVDGISLWLVALTALLTYAAVLASWRTTLQRPAAFYSLILLMQSGLIGVFAALDVVLFFVFLEFTLLPLFFLIGLWGGYRRRPVVKRFVILNLTGSLLILFALSAMVVAYSWMRATPTAPFQQLTFSIPELVRGIPSLTADRELARSYWDRVSPWIFLTLLVGIAIKVPLAPFHSWFPSANNESPTAVNILLAGVVLKIGCYTFVRFVVPVFPMICLSVLGFVSIVVVIAVIYSALLTLVQDDLKRLLSYACVSHMGFCLLALFTLNSVGVTGGLLQLINHGLSVAALFLLLGLIHQRTGLKTGDAEVASITNYPLISLFFAIAVFSLMGVPGLNGFVSELLMLFGIFRADPMLAVWGLFALLLLVWALLRMLFRVFSGQFPESGLSPDFPMKPFRNGSTTEPTRATATSPITSNGQPPTTDLTLCELAVLVPLTTLILWIGVYPQFVLDKMEPSVSNLLSVYAGLSL